MEVLGCNTNNGSESKKRCNRDHWRPEEDERLKQLVMQNGPRNWNFISQNIEGRSGKSCRLRWYNQLSPNVIKKPLSDEEEEMLLTLHKMKGNKWATIAKFFPGRTDNALKNHFNVLLAKRKRASNNLNIGILDMPLLNASSTITSSFDSSAVSSSIAREKYQLGSSSSSSIIKFSNSSYSPRIQNLMKSTSTLCKLNMETHEEESHEGIGVNEKGVAFIDFLGVGSSSGHDENISRP